MTGLLELTPDGLYCPQIDAHIDPVHPVRRAIVTHGHADHAKAGHHAVLATRQTLNIMALRYGGDFCANAQALAYGEKLAVNGLDVSLHPAGHVLGSAQVLLQGEGGRTVVSGDFKRQPDPTCAPFECLTCDTFVTEATFGLPVFRHPPARGEVRKLLDSLSMFPEKVHLVGAYVLGKAQRVIGELRSAGYDRPVYLHGSLIKLTEYYEAEGIALGPFEPVGQHGKDLAGQIVMCPPGQLTSLWVRRFGETVTAMASGWMRVRARARQRGAELPLIVSDHADWNDLCRTIEETQASQIWVTHGAEEALVHWCRANGRAARPLNMIGYEEEEDGVS